MKPVIVGIDSRCRHGIPLALGMSTCDRCEHESYMLSLRLPFDVLCIDGHDSDLNEDKVYTAVGVVAAGRAVNGSENPGLLLKAKNGESFPRLYHVRRFVEAS